MWPFKRKEEPKLIEPPPCKHKYQDFPLYVTSEYDGNRVTITVHEPYICIYCKDRKDISLERTILRGVSRNKADMELDAKIKELGDRCKPLWEVEDMIHDFQLVDREWLELAKFVRTGQKSHEKPAI